MKVFRHRQAMLLLALFSLTLLVTGCGDGDGDSKGAAPKDISGVWHGTWTSQEGTAHITVTTEQSGKDVAGSFSIEAEGRVVETGTFSGTYENGVLLIAGPEGDSVHFQGNTAWAQFADGSAMTIERVS
jgi:hypothetical protein